MRTILRYSSLIKAGLVVVAIGFALATVWYTSSLVNQLEKRQRQVAGIWARALENLVSDQSGTTDLTFIFEEIVSTIDFPIIVTTAENDPIPGFYRNITVPATLDSLQSDQYLRDLIVRFDKINPPIDVKLDSVVILQRIHFGHSDLVEELIWFPYVQITSVTILILLGYLAFSLIRKQEQSSVWVGMSKETAHQLGTPLSGLLAWMEVLKGSLKTEEANQVLKDMQTDIDRLLMVTDRFSKIGSKPVLTPVPLMDEIRMAVAYLQKRLPKSAEGGVILEISGQTSPVVRVNRLLFQWALENVLKNAADAGASRIQINLMADQNRAIIDVTDNGKGMSRQQARNIFRPGFTTKPRGWGMGLSLTRRIIETYHGGKISVFQTAEGIGTTIRLVLTISPEKTGE
ncbi:MAG: HAMP domain-containing histidine kinase [Bacteroidetes bacterium]|nr:HAMP domain-containing histidine kinase [Bacteroidota bacterium]